MAMKLLELIRKNNIKKLIECLKESNTVDIAKAIIELDDKDLILVFRLLPKDTSAQVFSYLDNEYQEKILKLIRDDEVKEIIDRLFLDDIVDVVEELPANVVKKLIRNTSFEKRNLINEFLNYKEDSAGAIMTIEFVALKEEMSVKEAINYTRKTGVNKETIETLFVIDKGRVLKGILSIKDLLLSEDNVLISDLMETNNIYVKTDEDQEYVAKLFKEYDLLAMPIVDKEKRLVGIITVDDIVDIIEKENTEDFHKMAAMSPSEEPYLKTSVFTLAKKRITWLLVLMVSATITGTIIQGFEDVIQSIALLASFIPMLMDTGGNAGAQSSTLVIRGLALGEITTKDYLKVISKEFRVSTIVASVLFSVNFLRLYFISKVSVAICLTVCGSLFFTVIAAKVVGGMLPIISKKLNLDPAIMASPLITTIVDAFALLIYFGFARTLLGI